MLEVTVSYCTSNSILDRSKTLLSVDDNNQNPATKCIKASNIDKAKFRSFLPHPMPMVGWENVEIDIESVCYSLSCCMYEASKKAKIVRNQSVTNVNRTNRWQWLRNEKDSKLIWRVINWNGTFDRILKTQPSDDEQANYFKTLFETRVTDNLDINTQPSTYIPILDDPITELEVENGIKIIKK